MMRGLISGLIRRSAEHQLRNTTCGLRKFIDSANILTAIHLDRPASRRRA